MRYGLLIILTLLVGSVTAQDKSIGIFGGGAYPFAPSEFSDHYHPGINGGLVAGLGISRRFSMQFTGSYTHFLPTGTTQSRYAHALDGGYHIKFKPFDWVISPYLTAGYSVRYDATERGRLLLTGMSEGDGHSEFSHYSISRLGFQTNIGRGFLFLESGYGIASTQIKKRHIVPASLGYSVQI